MKSANTVCFFRADASDQIGVGHVMRCYTLALELQKSGVNCHFIVRRLPEGLIKLLENSNIEISFLEYPLPDSTQPFAVDSALDRQQTFGVIASFSNQKCCLVVDHYGLDAEWERPFGELTENILVIDDLANRPHECGLLLDQTFKRDASDYAELIANDTKVLAGSYYALLREEFPKLRQRAIEKRRDLKAVNRLLISLGGGNAYELLRDCLIDLENSELKSISIDVIAGAVSERELEQLAKIAENSRFSILLHQNVANMAVMMLEADIAIGAAGTSSWERCCLGLPTIMFVIADNQKKIAAELNQFGAVRLVEKGSQNESVLHHLYELMDIQQYRMVSSAAIDICDGGGAKRVAQALLDSNHG